MLKRSLLVLSVVVVVATILVPASGSILSSSFQLGDVDTYLLTYDDTDWLSGPGRSWTYRGTFVGGVRYKFRLDVPFGADFDIKIYDENGNLVAKGTKVGSADETVFITPRWTGPFRIVVYSYSGSGFYTLKLYKRL